MARSRSGSTTKRSRSGSTTKEVSKIILDYAMAYASKKGFRFGAGADQYMRQHAINAANQINALPKSKQSAKLKEAKKNFARLIDGMIKEYHTGYEAANPGTIGEVTLYGALKFVCPAWPFC
jgi:hypothetical protein